MFQFMLTVAAGKRLIGKGSKKNERKFSIFWGDL